MHFFSIKNFIAEGWEIVSLAALERTTTPVEAMLFQPLSDKLVDVGGVRERNPEINDNKYDQFVSLVREAEPSLVITPEYSCSWNMVETIVSNANAYPSRGKLWVLGCESITQLDLRAVRERLEAQDVTVIHEELPNAPAKFLDPVCFFFWIKDRAGNNFKKVVAIQFKTQHMGARGVPPIEQQNLLQGDRVYIFSNMTNSHKLLTLVCSEAMAFAQMDVDHAMGGRWIDDSFLVLSLQLNSKPYHPEFVSFRKKVLDFDNKDLICINHAKGTRLNGRVFIEDDGSLVCVKTHEPEMSDALLELNQGRGLYIHKRNEGVYLYQLANDEGVISLRTDKPSMSGAGAPLNRKRGPEVTSYRVWQNNQFRDVALPNYFEDYLTSLGFPRLFTPLGSLDSERIVSISTGEISTSSPLEWHKLEKMMSFKLRADDSSQRVTVVHHNSGEAGTSRRTKVQKFSELKEIITEDRNFSNLINLTGFIGKHREISFVRQGGGNFQYEFNLIVPGGNERATVAYIGLATETEAKAAFSRLRKIFRDNNYKRVVVWYTNGGRLQSVAEKELPKINDVEEIDKITG